MISMNLLPRIPRRFDPVLTILKWIAYLVGGVALLYGISQYATILQDQQAACNAEGGVLIEGPAGYQCAKAPVVIPPHPSSR